MAFLNKVHRSGLAPLDGEYVDPRAARGNWQKAIDTLFFDDAYKCVNGDAMSCVYFYGNLVPGGRAGEGASMGSRIARALGKCSSFVPGTAVLMADGTHKPIEDIKVGEKVLATDPRTGETHAQPVLGTITSKGDKNLVQITVNADAPALGWMTRDHSEPVAAASLVLKKSKSGVLIATDTHPFWVAGDINAWVEAADLKAGMWLRTSAGTYVQVTAAEHQTVYHQRVHNLTIANPHTYYVIAGDAPTLVHNAGGCIPWSSGALARASKELAEGATSITVKNRSEAEELFLRTYQGAGYRNTSGMSGATVRREYRKGKRGTYHWDDNIGPDGRVAGHGAGNRHGDLPHIQIHTLEGPIVRIFWRP
jgi:hypothetical protein